MSKEETNLSNSLQKLEIEACSSAKKIKPETDIPNPFMRRKRSKSLSSVNLFGSSCTCSKKQLFRLKNTTSFKRSLGNKKILRDPILKITGPCTKCSESKPSSHIKKCSDRRHCKLFGRYSDTTQDQDFRSIIDACEQLSLANANDGVQDYSLPSFKSVRTVQRNDVSQKSDRSSVNSSCSHQARMSASPPCDVTIDELASYFETFVHIPKKMSSMAEMMYI